MGCANSHEAVRDREAPKQQGRAQPQSPLPAVQQSSTKQHSTPTQKSIRKSDATRQSKTGDAAPPQSSGATKKVVSIHEPAPKEMHFARDQHAVAAVAAPLPPHLTGVRKAFVSGASPGSVHSAYQLGCTLGESDAIYLEGSPAVSARRSQSSCALWSSTAPMAPLILPARSGHPGRHWYLPYVCCPFLRAQAPVAMPWCVPRRSGLLHGFLRAWSAAELSSTLASRPLAGEVCMPPGHPTGSATPLPPRPGPRIPKPSLRDHPHSRAYRRPTPRCLPPQVAIKIMKLPEGLADPRKKVRRLLPSRKVPHSRQPPPSCSLRPPPRPYPHRPSRTPRAPRRIPRSAFRRALTTSFKRLISSEASATPRCSACTSTSSVREAPASQRPPHRSRPLPQAARAPPPSACGAPDAAPHSPSTVTCSVAPSTVTCSVDMAKIALQITQRRLQLRQGVHRDRDPPRRRAPRRPPREVRSAAPPLIGRAQPPLSLQLHAALRRRPARSFLPAPPQPAHFPLPRQNSPKFNRGNYSEHDARTIFRQACQRPSVRSPR